MSTSGSTPPDVPRDVVAALRRRQAEHWSTGRPLLVEQLVAPRSCESLDHELLLELILAEQDLRRSHGAPLPTEQYQSRFPWLAERIERLFTLRQLLDSGPETRSSPQNSTDDFDGVIEGCDEAFASDDAHGSGDPAQASSHNKPPSGPNTATVKVTAAASPGEAQWASSDGSTPLAIPARIGRYRVERVLGEGTFGIVYLGMDDELQRRVAIKVPRKEIAARLGTFERFLDEARALARLKHPRIVPVYDVGGADAETFYVVSSYIEGGNLSEYVRGRSLSIAEAATVVGHVAEALAHAHSHGLVHRDVKPANILIDHSSQPVLADFGMVLHEQDFGLGSPLSGTPAYMSPEQARGEGHRVDSRSDIFSLGVVLFELFAGRRPFESSTLSGLLERIATADVPSPRQFRHDLPPDAERICRKALARRVDERYATGLEFAEDLRRLVATLSGAAVSSQPAAGKSGGHQESHDGPSRVIPKGLRSFDGHDADFYLQLLPGPRNRDGLPESLRFWKTRIEETDADQTFPVGLMYGPSGCGKSSLVKAGLLPRLSDAVVPLYVECTSEETETRLRMGLQKRYPQLPLEIGLRDGLARVRTGGSPPAGGKLLIVLDQFEQWLHRRKDETATELVEALRQCDGARVQCVLMVRDDFWLAVSRFMRQIEVGVVEGKNSALVDLFDVDHARKVLWAFGRSLERLAEDPADAPPAQSRFIEQAVSGLADDGRVVCVRLALFAEMMKGRPWTRESLTEVGGTDGLGVTFLEEAFHGRTASPARRRCQKAARAVLRLMLPESGSNLKGRFRPVDELRQASGLAEQPVEFAELIAILDGELRLITPSDPEGHWVGDSAQDSVPPVAGANVASYQLTHDYLVSPIRTWLNRKQRESRRGRAELLLAERSAEWNARPLDRNLPALHEDLRIRLLTKASARTESQRKMLRRSGRRHLLRWGTSVLIVLALVGGAERFDARRRLENDRQRTVALVDSVMTAPADAVPFAIENLKPLSVQSIPLLKEAVDDGALALPQRLHAALALASFGEVKAGFLVDRIEDSANDELRNIVSALEPVRVSALNLIRTKFSGADRGDDETRRSFRMVSNAVGNARLAVAALHLGDPGPAVVMCLGGSDPDPRRNFYEVVAACPNDIVAVLKRVDESGDEPTRAAACLAVGRIECGALPESDRKAIRDILARWYLRTAAGGTRSAAEWALRQARYPLPDTVDADAPMTNRNWRINSAGMTMIRIAPGQFLMGQPNRGYGKSVEVTLTRPFFLADREVNRAQFEKFIDDPQTSPPDKPNWGGAIVDTVPTMAHPEDQVNWYDAVLYCNWLSRREGRKVCYERTGKKEKFVYAGNPGEYDAWRLVAGADGYRLPTEAEWEYACRAGSTTKFCCGNDTTILQQYAVIFSMTAAPCGSRSPNPWGLFDMHGNMWEWCHDTFVAQLPGGTDPVVDVENGERLARGGSLELGGIDAGSAYRISGIHPGVRYHTGGFRIACDR